MRSIVVTLTVGLALGSAIVAAAGDRFKDVSVDIKPVAGQVHILTGAGGNIAVFAGGDGVLMVDDQFAPLAPRLKAAIKSLNKGTVSWVVNTHWHGDHTGGNAEFGKHAVIVAHDNVRKKLKVDQISGSGKPVKAQPKHGLPVVTFPETLSLHLNGETVRLTHLPNGHTDGDIVVYFDGSKVWHLGDHFFNGRFPFVDTKHGGSLKGYLANVRTVLGLIGEGDVIIPGHGPVASKADLAAWLKTVEASVALIQKSKISLSLADAQKAGLPSEFKEMGSGFISTDKWIQTIYAAR